MHELLVRARPLTWLGASWGQSLSGGKGSAPGRGPLGCGRPGQAAHRPPLPSPQGWQGLKVVAEILNLLGPDRDTTETPWRRHPQPGALFGMALVWDFSLSQS